MQRRALEQMRVALALLMGGVAIVVIMWQDIEGEGVDGPS
jgi:hypothetical protein